MEKSRNIDDFKKGDDSHSSDGREVKDYGGRRSDQIRFGAVDDGDVEKRNGEAENRRGPCCRCLALSMSNLPGGIEVGVVRSKVTAGTPAGHYPSAASFSVGPLALQLGWHPSPRQALPEVLVAIPQRDYLGLQGMSRVCFSNSKGRDSCTVPNETSGPCPATFDFFFFFLVRRVLALDYRIDGL